MNMHPDYLLTMINNEHAALAADLARRSARAPRRSKGTRLSRIGAALDLPKAAGRGQRHRVMAVQLDSELPTGMPSPGTVG
ncbi:MAG: hypothetical protein M3Y77_10090 [Actinomycetota bacterium]|nr:hypothetical protein [Actinomycetota bacterium]